MRTRMVLYWVAKVTFLDQVAGFFYWVLVVLGLFLLVDTVAPLGLFFVIFPVYALGVTLFYIFVLKRVKGWFLKGNT